MASRPLPIPAFGEADLSNCEREQVQYAASIQPHGALLVLVEPDLVCVQASANAAAFLNLSEAVVGRSIDQIDRDLAAHIRRHLDEPMHTLPVAVRCRVGGARAEFNCLLHRPTDGGLVVELESAGEQAGLQHQLAPALNRIIGSSSLRILCDETAKIFRDFTAYDRVMVYRFDDQGHGEVFSEEREPELEAYLGNRYPASDIPQIARRLYERNRVRVLVDVEYTPAPLTPRLFPVTGRDLDMSLSLLRSMSPIHIQYLKNMGVSATLVVSLMVGGRLWGLVACHHYSPRFVNFEMRAVCELLAEAAATRVAALESFVQGQSELFVRSVEQRMIEAVSRDGDWRRALFDGSQSVLHPLGASGAAMLVDGEIITAGEVPSTQDIRAIAEWLGQQEKTVVFETASLGLDEPGFAPLTPIASGVLATAASATPGEYLIWFRPERKRTVTWGGNPMKPVIVGDDPSQLSPRRSFAQWHQLVEGTSEAWTPSDISTARLIGETVADVVLQFRAVAMLIAQDRLNHVSQQVRLSDQPVMIADARGHILLTNEAFEKLLRVGHPHLQWLDDLPQFFAEPAEIRQSLRTMLKHQRSWHVDALLGGATGETKPLMIRADPVFASRDRTLGFVLLFTDLTERKAAEGARRRFQDRVIEPHRRTMVGLDSAADVVYHNLLSSIIENAQLAALEISYGTETAHMPDMLESVRASVSRTADVLEHLMLHTARRSDDKP